MSNSIVKEKSKRFAVRVVRLYQYLSKEKHEFIMSRQLLKSGTSIGANVSEAGYAQSRNDFINKLSIAMKEAAETEYWLELLHDTGYIEGEAFSSISRDCSEICKMLIQILNTTKKNNC